MGGLKDFKLQCPGNSPDKSPSWKEKALRRTPAALHSLRDSLSLCAPHRGLQERVGNLLILYPNGDTSKSEGHVLNNYPGK